MTAAEKIRRNQAKAKPGSNGDGGAAPTDDEKKSDETPSPFPKPIPAPDLKGIAGEEAVWVTPGLLGADIITMFSALWKAGKTTWLSHLVRAVETGEDFCGLKCPLPCRIHYVTEESESLWASRRDAIGFGPRIEFSIRPFRHKPGFGDWMKFLEYLEGYVNKSRADLIVFDPLTNLWPVRDENDAAEVQGALMPLRALSTGRSLLLVHHNGKADGTQATASRGSGALPAFCDILLELRRTSPTDVDDRRRTIVGFSRYEATPKEIVVELAEDGSGYTAHGDRKTAERAKLYERLLAILPDNEPGLTVEETAKEFGSDKPQKIDLLAALRHGFEGGSFRRSGEGKRGKPYRFWLASDTEKHGPFKGKAWG
jgi:RecA-family ATPase